MMNTFSSYRIRRLKKSLKLEARLEIALRHELPELLLFVGMTPGMALTLIEMEMALLVSLIESGNRRDFVLSLNYIWLVFVVTSWCVKKKVHIQVAAPRTSCAGQFLSRSFMFLLRKSNPQNRNLQTAVVRGVIFNQSKS